MWIHVVLGGPRNRVLALLGYLPNPTLCNLIMGHKRPLTFKTKQTSIHKTGVGFIFCYLFIYFLLSMGEDVT